MKALAHTGLVPVIALVRSDYKAGTVYGLAPDQARAAVIKGLVKLGPIPSGLETIDVGPDPAPPRAAEDIEVVPETHDGLVEIPADWDKPPSEGGLQWMQQVKLAEQILQHPLEIPEGKKPAQVARDVISAELARRAAAEKPLPSQNGASENGAEEQGGDNASKTSDPGQSQPTEGGAAAEGVPDGDGGTSNPST